MSQASYPIGKYSSKEFDETLLKEWIGSIAELPSRLEYAIHNLDEDQIHTAYREGGWTVHQLIHHVADSHTNAYIRFKLGLTEDNPLIKPYEQDAWSKMADTKNLPVNVSLTMLHSIHRRWHEILKNMEVHEWERTVYHPEHKQKMTLWYLLGMYVWHGLHHEAHILQLRNTKNW